MKSKSIDTTCYICAAVHSNKEFCNQIIEEIIKEEHRVIAKSYGVDINTVLKNCLLARDTEDSQNLKLALLLLLTIIISVISKDILLPILFYPFAYLIVMANSVKKRNFIASNLFKKSFDIEYKNSVWNKKNQEIVNEQQSNVIIYRDFLPFVGSGTYINGWSFNVNINKGKQEGQKSLKPLSFNINDIHEYISNSIIKLNLYNLTIEDNLHINGREIRDDKRFLPDPTERPCTFVDTPTMRDFIEKPTHTVRHYKCIRVIDWNGELILSIFLRIVRIGQNLFIESSYYLLPPLRDYYRQFDNILPEATSRELGLIVIQSIFKSIFYWLLSPFAVLHRFNSLRKERRQRQIIKHYINRNPNFNYGATNSLRERVSSSEYRQYFQQLDQDMYLKIIEQQIIDSIKTFLETKNIDTSDFQQARSQILNYGLIVYGGIMEAKNLAVGENAKSMTTDRKHNIDSNNIKPST